MTFQRHLVWGRGLERLCFGIGVIAICGMTAFAVYAALEQLIGWQTVPFVSFFGLIAASPVLIIGYFFRWRRIRQDAALADYRNVLSEARLPD